MLTVVGMDPAGLHLMTPAAREAVATADVLVGGKRHLQQLPDFTGKQFALGANIPELLSWTNAHQERHVVVLTSGDPLFYSIEMRTVTHFGIENVWVIPGISTVQYLCVQSGIDMNGMWLISSHGRGICFDGLTRHNKMAMATDALCDPREIAQQLITRGKGHHWIMIGENLAMENGQIHFLPVREANAGYNIDAVVVLDER